jgi:hypothetical protein
MKFSGYQIMTAFFHISLPIQTSRNQTLACGRAGRKKLLYPDFTNRPDQKSNALNPGDSANPNTTKKSLLFCKDITCNRLRQVFRQAENWGRFAAALDYPLIEESH